MRKLAQFLPDGFTLSILAIVILGAFFPCSGEFARIGSASPARSRSRCCSSCRARGCRAPRCWPASCTGGCTCRSSASTFIVFPLLGLALQPISGTVIAPPLYVGLLFLCTLPSTVQASVIFTSVAGGNVAAALCSASLSSIIGMALTPLLIGLLLHAHGESSLNGVVSIALQVLVPFVLGQVAQRWLEPWMKRNQKTVRRVDLGSILLMVYGAISAATLSGMWRLLPVTSFLVLVAVDGVLLAVMLSTNVFVARRLGFAREDEIAIAFCGTQKSLIMGIPMANALFAGSTLGFVVLPMIVYHQMQFMTCADIARRYARSERQRVLAVGKGD